VSWVWMAVALAIFWRATRSQLVKTPGYRLLFLLVVVGLLLICMLPEAAFVLPTLDAVGLDIVTIWAGFELRHYILFLARLSGMPTLNVIRRGLGPPVGRCLSFILAPTKPEMLPCACVWMLIAFRVVVASLRVPPQAHG